MLKNIKTFLNFAPCTALAFYAAIHPVDPELLSQIQLWMAPVNKLTEQIEKHLEDGDEKK
jgi:hypothetical protein